MGKLYNRAKMTVSGTPGTGTITLLAAAAGFQTFASAGVANGDVVSYVIEDGTNWEFGQGTYTSAGTTLARTVQGSSAGGTTAISATSSALVFVSALAADLLLGGGFSVITNSIGADVALNNTANFFDGPSVAQGTTGTWFASGRVLVISGAISTIYVKLWDGTTVIDSTLQSVGGGNYTTLALSGRIASPAGNIRLSVKDSINTSGRIVANDSGLGKDSTITAFRVA